MCIVSNGSILLPRKQALSNDCIAIRVLNKRCNSCASADFTGEGQTVQVKPIKCSRYILVCDWQDVWDILPK